MERQRRDIQNMFRKAFLRRGICDVSLAASIERTNAAISLWFHRFTFTRNPKVRDRQMSESSGDQAINELIAAYIARLL